MPVATKKRPQTRAVKKKSIAQAKTSGPKRRIDDAHLLTSGEIPIAEIAVVENDRQTFDKSELTKLQKSIERHGVLQPLVVCPDGDGYRLVAGERRLRAAKLAGLKTVPVRISSGDPVNVDQLQVAEQRLDENLQRVDLDPIEKAIAVKGLIDKGRKQKDVAAILGCNASQVSNIVRLLELPEKPWQQWVATGKLAPTAARALIPWVKRPQVLQRLIDKHSADIDEGNGPEGALTTDERAELLRLRRENRRLEQERDFLKKAAAFFAKKEDRRSRRSTRRRPTSRSRYQRDNVLWGIPDSVASWS